MIRTRLLALLMAGALLAGACSSAAVSQAEFDDVTVERDSAMQDAAAAVEATEQAQSELDRLTSQLESKDAEAADLESANRDLEAQLKAAESAVEANAQASADAQAALQEILVKFDVEIRAELETEVAAEVSRACDEAKADVDSAIAGIVRWSPDWEPVSTEADLIAAVESCSSAERSKTVEQREDDRLASCESVDIDALEKNPDKYAGTCIHMWARIVQYDSNTGVCTFRADMSRTKTTRWYDYDGNAIISSASDPICPELDDIDKDDFIEVWATGAGTLTYDTTIGGSATATLWVIERVLLVKKE